MRLFTCKKYDFLIEKNLPSLPASHPISRPILRPIESEIEFIFPSTQNQGGADRFTEDLSEFRQIYLWIQVLVVPLGVRHFIF